VIAIRTTPDFYIIFKGELSNSDVLIDLFDTMVCSNVGTKM